MIGLEIHQDDAQWFEEVFMLEVCQWHSRRFGMDGSLLSLITAPISNGSAQFFSAVVYRIPSRGMCMYSLGRMEWLALELVTEARQTLLTRKSLASDQLWEVIERKLQCCRFDTELSIAFASHNNRKESDSFDISGACTGERADVLLLAKRSGAEVASILGWACHASSFAVGTASMCPGQSYPEHRILWRQCIPLHDLMRVAACSLAERLDLARPVSVQGDLDEAVWNSDVFSQDSGPLEVVGGTEVRDNDSDIVCGTEN